MAESDLLDQLGALDRLTRREAALARFFRACHRQLAFETVSSISAKTGVSKATVVRFIAKLGYARFGDFQKRLQAEVMQRLESPTASFAQYRRSGKGARDYLGQSIRQALLNLEEARGAIPFDLLMKAARLLAFSPGSVYVTGQITSYGQAHFFWVGAMYLRPGVRLLDHAQSTLPCQLADVTPDDVLLAVTRRRRTKQTLRVIAHFVQRGAKVILLTDDIDAPSSPRADIRLLAPAKGAFVFASACTAMAVLDALLWAMADLLNERVSDRLEHIERLQKGFDTHAAPGERVFPIRPANPGGRAKRRAG